MWRVAYVGYWKHHELILGLRKDCMGNVSHAGIWRARNVGWDGFVRTQFIWSDMLLVGRVGLPWRNFILFVKGSCI